MKQQQQVDGCWNASCNVSLPYMKHFQYIAVAYPILPNLQGLFNQPTNQPTNQPS